MDICLQFYLTLCHYETCLSVNAHKRIFIQSSFSESNFIKWLSIQIQFLTHFSFPFDSHHTNVSYSIKHSCLGYLLIWAYDKDSLFLLSIKYHVLLFRDVLVNRGVLGILSHAQDGPVSFYVWRHKSLERRVLNW